MRRLLKVLATHETSTDHGEKAFIQVRRRMLPQFLPRIEEATPTVISDKLKCKSDESVDTPVPLPPDDTTRVNNNRDNNRNTSGTIQEADEPPSSPTL